MTTAKKPLPAYDAPPLVEVVFGRQFDPLQLSVAHAGLLWERLDREAYPHVQEQPPLPPVIEAFDEQGAPEIYIGDVLSPRLWFTSREHDSLIQLQRDRFLVNWRAGGQPYPRYSALFPKFEAVWATFENFVQAELGLAPSMRQFELTYVNHIPWAPSWPDLGTALRATFPDLAWRTGGRFLVAPESGETRFAFRFPDNAGRLHVRLREGRRMDGARIFMLDFTARGFLPDAVAWFEMAHDWIVRGFADLTSTEMQEQTWQLKQ
jgi:uncharacterized protein (TIGR04255 family)